MRRERERDSRLRERKADCSIVKKKLERFVGKEEGEINEKGRDEYQRS